jgi:hypothetical protein
MKKTMLIFQLELWYKRYTSTYVNFDYNSMYHYVELMYEHLYVKIFRVGTLIGPKRVFPEQCSIYS